MRVEICPDELPIDGDPDRLRQVQVNLLDNAIKYSPPGGDICIQATREKDQAVIRVSDCGEGLSAESIENIFEPFYQAAPAKGHRLGGMGLGLSVVKIIVEQHGGTVEARSDGPGQGSEFTVRLPLVIEPKNSRANDGDAMLSVTPARGHEGKGGEQPRKIVLIEDQEDNRQMLTRWLELKGHQVQSTHDGPSGVALIESVKPDVAIIDIGLPKINGYEVARRIRGGISSDNVYLIALTGYGQPSDIEAAQQAGFNHHLIKPVNPEELDRLLAKNAKIQDS